MIMARLENRSGGAVVLPDARIEPGETFEASADVLKMSGVVSMIESGDLVRIEDEKPKRKKDGE